MRRLEIKEPIMSFISDTILVALELSKSLWLVGTRVAGARSSQMHRVSAGDTVMLLRLLDGCGQVDGIRVPGRPLRSASSQGVMDSGFIVC
jgi:hypothetical protein